MSCSFPRYCNRSISDTQKPTSIYTAKRFQIPIQEHEYVKRFPDDTKLQLCRTPVSAFALIFPVFVKGNYLYYFILTKITEMYLV